MASSCLAWAIVLRQCSQCDWATIRKFSDNAHISSHRPYGFSQCRYQQIAAFFESRDAVLGNPEPFGDTGLRELAGLPKVAQAHFLSDYLSRAVFYLLALSWAQFPNYFIHVHRHGYVPLSNPVKMGVKTLVGLPYQLAIEALFAS